MTQSSSMRLIWLLTNDQPTCSAVDWTGAMCTWLFRGHCWSSFKRSSCEAHISLGGGVSPAIQGEVNSSSAHKETFPRRVETGTKRFIRGESIRVEARQTIWKDERPQQGFAFYLNCFVNPGGGNGIEPFSVCSDPRWRSTKNTPLLPRNVCGSRVKCSSFCSPTRPIITVQSTNNSRFISTTAQLETVATMPLPWTLGSHAVHMATFLQPQTNGV